MKAAGRQAVVGSGDEGLARQFMLPQPADALPANLGTPGVLADQLARKQRKKQGTLDVSGTASCSLSAAQVSSKHLSCHLNGYDANCCQVRSCTKHVH